MEKSKVLMEATLYISLDFKWSFVYIVNIDE